MRIRSLGIVALLLLIVGLSACGGNSSTSNATATTSPPPPTPTTLSQTYMGSGDIVGNGDQNPFRAASHLYKYSDGQEAQVATGNVPGVGSGVVVFLSDSDGVHQSDFFPPFDSQGNATQTLSLSSGDYTITIHKTASSYTITRITVVVERG